MTVEASKKGAHNTYRTPPKPTVEATQRAAKGQSQASGLPPLLFSAESSTRASGYPGAPEVTRISAPLEEEESPEVQLAIITNEANSLMSDVEDLKKSYIRKNIEIEMSKATESHKSLEKINVIEEVISKIEAITDTITLYLQIELNELLAHAQQKETKDSAATAVKNLKQKLTYLNGTTAKALKQAATQISETLLETMNEIDRKAKPIAQVLYKINEIKATLQKINTLPVPKLSLHPLNGTIDTIIYNLHHTWKAPEQPNNRATKPEITVDELKQKLNNLITHVCDTLTDDYLQNLQITDNYRQELKNWKETAEKELKISTFIASVCDKIDKDEDEIVFHFRGLSGGGAKTKGSLEYLLENDVKPGTQATVKEGKRSTRDPKTHENLKDGHPTTLTVPRNDLDAVLRALDKTYFWRDNKAKPCMHLKAHNTISFSLNDPVPSRE